MPEPNTKPRTQAERRAQTRSILVDTARKLFLEKGYDQTGMPELVKEAGLTRGALYHHFTDKADLFRAVALLDATRVGALIDERTRHVASPEEGMVVGTAAYFEAMSVPGCAEILLVMAPAILGHDEAQKLTDANGGAELRDGLAQAMPDASAGELDALTDVLAAAFDRAALNISKGGDQAAYTDALFKIIERLFDQPTP